MTPPSNRAPTVGLPLVLAVVMPVLVLIGASAGLDRLARADQRLEDENAGHVMNGEVTRKSGSRVRVDRLMRRHDPRVIVLGNSLSNTDLSAAVLEAALDLPTDQVQKFSLPGSIGAHWTAILENRVIDAGYTPALALIVTDWPSLLSVQPHSESSYLSLVQHLDDDDPDFDAILGKRWTSLDRIREDRGELRERIVGGVRNLAVASLTGRRRGVDDALARVFAPDALDPRLHGAALPIVDPSFDRMLPVFDPAFIPHPVDSFVPRLAERAHDAGVALVVVRPPMSPRLPPGIGDVVEPTTEASLHAVLRAWGAWDLDLRRLPVTDGDFVNLDHMNAEGSDRFTRVVADLVRRVGAWERPEVAVDWLAPGRIAQGRYLPSATVARYPIRPPPLKAPERPLTAGGPGWGSYDAPGWGFLSDRATRDVTPWATRCSPIQVLEDGAPLPRPHETCAAVQRFGRGRACHDEQGIRFATVDRSDPTANGRRYRLALDPTRRCERARWLYPGDVMILRGEAPTRASVLSVRVHDQSPRPDPGRPEEVEVSLRQGPRTLVTARVAAPGPPASPARLGLREPVLPSAGPIELVITSRSGRFLMVTEAKLLP